MTHPRDNYHSYKNEIDDAIGYMIGKGMYVGGEEVALFEEEFAKYTKANNCVSVANGTDALTLALKALGIGRGDEVITVSYTVSATIAAILLAGATPFLVDINPLTLTMDTEELEYAITERTKAVLPVHLFGWPADIFTITEIAENNELFVIEDCAHSHGGNYLGKTLGTWGDMGCFSFYPTKNLGALGDAGAIVTGDNDLAAMAKSLRQYGWGEHYETELIGGCNSRMDSIQAAILRVKLKHLDKEIQKRRELAEIYHVELADTSIKLPPPNSEFHVYHKFTVRHQERNDLELFLTSHNINTTVYYRKPIHMQSAYQGLETFGHLEETEKAAKECISLPLWPELSGDYSYMVCGLIKEWEAKI